MINQYKKKVEEINKKKLCATHACICVDRKREEKSI